MFPSGDILGIIIQFVLRMLILMPSIILHEVAHGWAAYKLGDNTAKRAGRLTLNPISHIDPWGTILLPLILLVGSGGTFSFGFAKPVPINPYFFKKEREGMLITGAAGPVVNIMLAVVLGLTLRFTYPMLAVSNVGSVVAQVLLYAAQLNLMLAFFNLIPIPPLDGSRILQRFLPTKIRNAYHQLEPYGFFIVIGLTYFVPQVFYGYLNLTVDPILTLILG